MSIPKFKDFFKPVLEVFADGEKYKTKSAADKTASILNLAEHEKNEKVKSGKSIIESRTYWAINYMCHAGILEKTDKSEYTLTKRGKDIVSKNFDNFSLKSLHKYPEFIRYITKINDEDDKDPEKEISKSETIGSPDEIIQNIYEQKRRDLAMELLEKIKKQTPDFFEKLVMEHMLKWATAAM